MSQLSLFPEYTEQGPAPEVGSATGKGDTHPARRAAGPRRRKAGLSARIGAPPTQSGSGVPGESGDVLLSLPFDDPSANVQTPTVVPPAAALEEPLQEPDVAAPPPALLPRTERRTASRAPALADLFSCLAEAGEETQVKIAFDPHDWQLRPDLGDFIHIRTGEVREEDAFLQIETDAPEEFPEWNDDLFFWH